MLQAGLEGAARGLELISLRQAIDQLELRFARLAVEFDRSECWDYEGANSAIDWIRINCKMTSNAISDRIAVGEHSSDLAESTQAMDAGEIGFAHLAVMARTANAVGDAFDETMLLRLAKESSPGRFHYNCLHYRHALNAEAYADEQADQAQTRTLHMSTGSDGCLFITGLLDPVGGAVVRNALEPLARPSGVDDHRLRPQRYADALVELAGHTQKIQMQVTSSVETLLNLTGAPGAEMEFSLPVSSKTVERWACDSTITRVLMQESVVIDVGRAKRVVSGPARRALNARDRHCRWPGCERPASWCDGHHVMHWIHGGGSELENQVLLCTRHHWKVHEGNWQLVKTDDGRVVPVAPTVRFGLPRGPD